MSKFINPWPQYLDENGNPYAGGTVFFGEPNQDPVNNPKAPFSDKALQVPIGSSQVLDDKGMFQTTIFLSGFYSASLFDVDNNFIRTDPNFSGNLTALAVKNFATLALAVSNASLVDGDTLVTGDRGGASWNVVLSSTVTENTFNIVQCTGVATLSLVLRSEIIRFKEWGADPTGTVISTAALVAALANGGTVEGEEGDTYLVDGRVDIKSNTTINANGMEIKYTAMTGFGLISENTSNVKVFNLKIDGDKLTYNPVDAFGIWFKTVDNFEIAGCFIHDVFRVGIQVGHLVTGLSTNGFIHDNHIISVGDNRESTQYGNGIAVTHGQFLVIESNIIDDIYGTGGINLEGDTYSDITVRGNLVRNGTGSNLRGIMQFESGSEVHDNIIITDNIVSGLPAAGITMLGDGKRVVANNIIENCGEEGIRIASSPNSDVTIANNQINNCGSLTVPCLTVGSSSNLIVTNNKITDCPTGSTVGMQLTSTDSAIITGNIVNDVQTNAFELACNNFVLSNNSVDNIGVIGSGTNYFLKNKTSSVNSNGTISGNTLTMGAGTGTAFWLINGGNWVDVEVSENQSSITKYQFTAASNSSVKGILAPNSPDLGSVFGNTAAWKVGDRLYNDTPTLGEGSGWVCITAGTPGTWGAFGHLVPSATSAELADITDAINTDASKTEGFQVLNTNTGLLVVAAGNADGSVWVFSGTGNTSVTPV